MGRVKNVVLCPRCKHPIRAYNIEPDWMYCKTCGHWICRKHPKEYMVRCGWSNHSGSTFEICYEKLCPLCAKVVQKGSAKVYVCSKCLHKAAEKELST